MIKNKFYKKNKKLVIMKIDGRRRRTMQKNEILPYMLPEKEVKSLLEKRSEEESRTKLIEHHLRLVVLIIREFKNKNYLEEQLMSVGIIGLIKAIDKYSEKHGVFNHFVAKKIKEEIDCYTNLQERFS